MQFHEKYNLTLGLRSQYPLHHVTDSDTKFEVTMPNSLGGDAINTLFDLWVKVTQNVTQYPLHHVTYSGAKFEVATSNSLGGDAFTKKYII